MSELRPLSRLKRMMLIINPVSGKRTSLRFLPDIIGIFNNGGYAVSVFPTGKRGDATDLAEQYSADFDIVVCIGGDGTLNETITGLVRSKSGKPLGYIPSGSTNDFAACHGIPSDMLRAAMNIVSGSAEKIDIGQFQSRYFCYVAAFGAFSWLSYTTPQNLKNVLGHSAYIIDAVKDLPKVKSHRLKLTSADSVCEGDFIFGAICNSTSVAGTLTLPESIVDTGDGIFEVLLVRKPKTIIDFQGIVADILTHDYSSPFLEFIRGSSFTIEASPRLDWSLDGERGEGSADITVKNLKRELTLIC